MPILPGPILSLLSRKREQPPQLPIPGAFGQVSVPPLGQFPTPTTMALQSPVLGAVLGPFGPGLALGTATLANALSGQPSAIAKFLGLGQGQKSERDQQRERLQQALLALARQPAMQPQPAEGFVFKEEPFPAPPDLGQAEKTLESVDLGKAQQAVDNLKPIELTPEELDKFKDAVRKQALAEIQLQAATAPDGFKAAALFLMGGKFADAAANKAVADLGLQLKQMNAQIAEAAARGQLDIARAKQQQAAGIAQLQVTKALEGYKNEIERIDRNSLKVIPTGQGRVVVTAVDAKTGDRIVRMIPNLAGDAGPGAAIASNPALLVDMLIKNGMLQTVMSPDDIEEVLDKARKEFDRVADVDMKLQFASPEARDLALQERDTYALARLYEFLVREKPEELAALLSAN